MSKAKYKSLLEKSISAALSAIELYNKPNFDYREESFTILIVNAWELLLKAKMLKDKNNRLNCLYIPIPRKKSDGTNSKKFKYKTNRSGTFMTLGITKLIELILEDQNIKNNLEILIEIRDNNIHFINDTKLFEKYFLEVALACLKNYSLLVNKWFNESLHDIDLFLIPLAFNVPKIFEIESLNKENSEHKKLLAYISKQKSQITPDSEFNVSIIVDVKLERNKQGDINVKYDKDGIPVFMDSEDVFKKKFPWDYSQLIEQCKNRYIEFKTNKEFHNLRKSICEEKELKGIRYLDPIRNIGMKKDFYSSNIINELDKHYTKR